MSLGGVGYQMSSQTDRIWKSHQPTCPCTGHAQDSADSETSTTGSTNSFLSDSCTKFFPLCHGAQSDIARRHRAPTIKDRCWDHTCPFPSAACSCVPGLKAGQWPGTLPSGLNFASSGDVGSSQESNSRSSTWSLTSRMIMTG